jgi:phosphoenolpyruvate---glycerone phosphotransferase subunit DhaL
MPEGLTAATLKKGLRRICLQMEASAAELNELDGALGDGDLGITMVRGCRAIEAEIDTHTDDVGTVLLKCAKAFTRTSGSTFGTLLATGLMSVAKATKGRSEVPWRELPDLFGQALDAMMKRGKAQLGDKTVLDAVEAVRAAMSQSGEPGVMLQASRLGMAKVLDRMRNLPARQGRARIFGDKSIGRDDPGMVVFQQIVEALDVSEYSLGVE